MNDLKERTLPPLVAGKLTALLDIMVDEVEIVTVETPRNNICDIMVQIQWWGESSPIYLRPLAAKFMKKKNIVTDNIDASHHSFTYNVKTNLELLKLYLKSCEVMELTVIDKIVNSVIGSAFLRNIALTSCKGKTLTLPIINYLGDFTGEMKIRLLFHNFNSPEDLNENVNEKDIYRGTPKVLPQSSMQTKSLPHLCYHGDHQSDLTKSADNVNFSKKHEHIIEKVQLELQNLGVIPNINCNISKQNSPDRIHHHERGFDCCREKNLKENEYMNSCLNDHKFPTECPKHRSHSPEHCTHCSKPHHRMVPSPNPAMTLKNHADFNCDRNQCCREKISPHSSHKNMKLCNTLKQHSELPSPDLDRLKYAHMHCPEKQMEADGLSHHSDSYRDEISDYRMKCLNSMKMSKLCSDIIKNAKSDTGIPNKMVKEIMKENELPRTFTKVTKEVSNIEDVLLTPTKFHFDKYIKYNSYDETPLRQNTKVFDYLLGKDMTKEEEKKAIKALRSMSPCDDLAKTLGHQFPRTRKVPSPKKYADSNVKTIAKDKQPLAFNLNNPVEKLYYETFFRKGMKEFEDFEVAEYLNPSKHMDSCYTKVDDHRRKILELDNKLSEVNEKEMIVMNLDEGVPSKNRFIKSNTPHPISNEAKKVKKNVNKPREVKRKKT